MVSRLSIVLLSLLSTFVPSTAGADWPQWRGADGTGTTDDGFRQGPVQMELLWRHDLGSGYASVSVADDLAITSAAFEGSHWVVALDVREGSVVWRRRVGEVFVGRSGSDDGPQATPAIGGDRVVVLEPDGVLVALAIDDGRELWRRDLVSRDGARVELYGVSAAPLIADGRVIVQLGAEDGLISAFDLADGASVWIGGVGEASHQNPSILELGGVRQVVTQSRRSLQAFDLANGTALWTWEFEEPSESGDIVALGRDRLLATRWQSSTAFAIRRDGEDFGVEELWTSGDLARTYGVPVRVGDHLYGLKDRFLSCVAIDSGERVWRSRPPGGSGLIAAGGKLFTSTPDGHLTAVAVSAEGPRPLGSLPVFAARRVFTPPSAADGVVFVRNLEQIAAVRVTAAGQTTATALPSATPEAETVIASLAAAVETAAGTAAAQLKAVDRFFDRYPESPIVDGDWVHFMYRGAVEDLVVQGDMTGFFTGQPMYRLAGTDVYYRTYPLPPGERWEYRFKEFDRSFPDPRNPTRVAIDDSLSVVTFAGWQEPDGSDDVSRGSLVERVLDNEARLEVTFYLPPGFEPEESLPIVVWSLGEAALTKGGLAEVLDRQAAAGRRVVGAFLRFPPRYEWAQAREQFGRALSERLLPLAAVEYGVASTPASRVLVTSMWNAEVALATALDHGFGGAALQSPLLPSPVIERLIEPAAAGRERFDLWLDHGRFDFDYSEVGVTAAMTVKELGQQFERLGLAAEIHETAGGGNWTRWRHATPAMLDHFFGR